jgi:hypothetical protein
VLDRSGDRIHLARQIEHWVAAAERLGALEDAASESAWKGLESYLSVAVRSTLANAVASLLQEGRALRASLAAAGTQPQFARVAEELSRFRRRYTRTEIIIDFYADAVNTRTSLRIAGLLRACDSLAYRSMRQVLDPLGKTTPVVLTYLDKGLGASILKAGLRLWDGVSENPAAAIKIVGHNLLRPTSILHEAGHQVAHIVGWNDELASLLERALSGAQRRVAATWASWASEVAADAFAFAHTGYASVVALHDVIAGEESSVLRFVPGDPHPIPYLRLLFGVEASRAFYGDGPWNELWKGWARSYDPRNARGIARMLVGESVPAMHAIVEITFREPMRALGGRSLAEVILPTAVSPEALAELERRLGPALYNSTHWVWNEALRLLALGGLRQATEPDRTREILRRQEAWMLRLGELARAA